MRQAIYVKRHADAPVETYFTTLFVITEWERIERRRLGDGLGFGLTELTVCLWVILKLKGEEVGESWRDWARENSDLEIVQGVDMTDPNPTPGDHSDES